MATWDIQKGEDKVCPQCESVYSVTHHQVPVKDIGSASPDGHPNSPTHGHLKLPHLS
jgi:hypothetical protein